jgi:hypothetical protein
VLAGAAGLLIFGSCKEPTRSVEVMVVHGQVTVRDSGGPIADAFVRLAWSDFQDWNTSVDRLVAQDTTDAAGQYTLPVRGAPGSRPSCFLWFVSVEKAGYYRSDTYLTPESCAEAGSDYSLNVSLVPIPPPAPSQ